MRNCGTSAVQNFSRGDSNYQYTPGRLKIQTVFTGDWFCRPHFHRGTFRGGFSRGSEAGCSLCKSSNSLGQSRSSPGIQASALPFFNYIHIKLFISFCFNQLNPRAGKKLVITHHCSSIHLRKRLWRRCFPVNFAKFLRTSFFNRTPLVAAFEHFFLENPSGGCFCIY